MSFSELHLKPSILKALEKKAYSDATPIQKELIPVIFSGHDVLAGAQTGTGKTAAFALPILQDLAGKFEEGKHYPKALILVPTRELAKQVHQSFVEYGEFLPLKSEVLYGGANFSAQTNRLKNGVDIIIATTGRLLEHIGKNHIDLKTIKFLVMDEADTILDMGFLNEVSQIFQHLPETRQNILISATLSAPLKKLSREVLHKPKRIEVDNMGTAASLVKQVVYPVEAEKKAELLSYLIGSRNYSMVMVFVRKRAEADMVAEELELSGLKTAVIHGEKSSGERSRALSDFKEGKIRVLVATDIAARGLDIPSLEVVFSYDIPHVTQDFIHRIGRTGRAGKAGLAITLISPSEMVALRDVERMLGRPLPKENLEGYAPKVLGTQKGARKSDKKKSTDGAFGSKKKKSTTFSKTKKRKTTKRDGFKVYDENKSTKDKKKGRK
ncbi:DEAD/DEAH box helicase [Sulfurovum sp. zt1-1]|uniref:DEAD/DEAH box helicase n=1 Tax=Sulfurovum zhangzhouensis TaxID=3019067 RepID=A0ABT7QV03_9BACT|nr:DEAD/DEAH box helicase [Sulfurovum zhangzhouensis]MDM5270672.1 DEAD/DEAH box helicase [Sulfurovum zhangzhouensis]